MFYKCGIEAIFVQIHPHPLKERWNLILNYSKFSRHFKNFRISMIAVWVFTISQYLRWDWSVTLEIDQSCEIILVRLVISIISNHTWWVLLILPLRFIKEGRLWCGGARETHCEPRFTMKWLLAKPRIFSNLHAF